VVAEDNLTVVYVNSRNNTRIRPLADAWGYNAERYHRSGL